jgi:hypothetical protein
MVFRCWRQGTLRFDIHPLFFVHFAAEHPKLVCKFGFSGHLPRTSGPMNQPQPRRFWQTRRRIQIFKETWRLCQGSQDGRWAAVTSNMIKSHDVTGLFVNCKMMLNDAKQVSRIWMIWTDFFQIYSVLLDHEIHAMMSWPKVSAVSSEVQAVWTAACEASGSAGTSCLETQWGVTDGPFVWNGMLRSCSGCLI